MEFPPEVIHRSKPRLSAAERAERARVHSPENGVGFAYGSELPANGEIDRWYQSLPEALKESFKQPNTTVRITGKASGTGGAGFNRRLANERAQVVADQLRAKYGFRGEVQVETKIAPRTGRDDARERVASIEVRTPRQKLLDAVGKAGKANREWWAKHGRPRPGDTRAQLRRTQDLDGPTQTKLDDRLLNGTLPDSHSFQIDGKLFLPNPETGKLRWIGLMDIPSGYTQQNGYFVYAKRRTVETLPRYIEEPKALQAELTRRGKQPSERQVRQLAWTNGFLNKRLDALLKTGLSLEQARTQLKQDSLDLFKRTIVPLVGIGI